MNKQKTIGDLVKSITGLNNEILAIKTLVFCNTMYHLKAMEIINKNAPNEFKFKHSWTVNSYGALCQEIDNEDYREALHNDHDPDLTEIQEFCAPMKNLEFKFSRFENLVRNCIMNCEVTGNKNGAYVLWFYFKTRKPDEKGPLFMRKFNPDDFNQESK